MRSETEDEEKQAELLRGRPAAQAFTGILLIFNIS